MAQVKHDPQILEALIKAESAPLDTEAVLKVKSEIVIEKTGRAWAEWYDILDGVGVAEKGSNAVVAHLIREYTIRRWWAETIVTRYEVILGLRD